MSTVQQAAPEAPRRPRLEVSLERLLQIGDRLHATSTNYQQLKSVLQASAQPDFDPQAIGVAMQLQIGDTYIPIPPPSDVAQFRAQIQDATESVGSLILELWAEAHAVTTEAVQHCNAAQQAAQPPQQPQ